MKTHNKTLESVCNTVRKWEVQVYEGCWC